MLTLFTQLADWLIYRLLNFDPDTRIGGALHFFVEDTSKIFFLLVVMIYVLALVRSTLNVEMVRSFLLSSGKGFGYVMGSCFGAITPFCSCSSIPLFLGFTSAGIPVGMTMAFLLTSPLINEVAVLLLLSLVGWKITLIYVVVGMSIGILGGLFLDVIGAQRFLQPFALKAYLNAAVKPSSDHVKRKLTFADRHRFAKAELTDILSRVWIWIFIGVALGAGLHGYLPQMWVENHLGKGQWWTVPLAVASGIPLYANATGIIPILESLIVKGLPVGTALAFCMSTVAASFPEFILLKQVMTWRLLVILFAMLLVAFTLTGWIINALMFF